jgi:hypothetical protein
MNNRGDEEELKKPKGSSSISSLVENEYLYVR